MKNKDYMLSEDGKVLLKYLGKDTAVTVPIGIERIAASAFSMNERITSVILPEGVTGITMNTFYNCKSLTEVYIPKSVTSLSSFIFRGCGSLKRVTVRGEIAYAENDIFYDTPSELEVLLLTPTLSAFGASDKVCIVRGFLSAYYSDEEIPDSATAQAERYIRSARKRLSSALAESYLFFKYLCDKKLIQYEEIDSYLTRAETPDAKAELLSYRDDIYTPALQKKLEKREERILDRMLSDAPPTVAELKSIWEVRREKDALYLKSYKGFASDVVIPGSIGRFPIVGILEEAFSPDAPGIDLGQAEVRREIRSVTVPSSVKQIGESAFKGCVSLESVTLTQGLEAIGVEAFKACVALARMDIPDTVKIIGTDAFEGTAILDGYDGDDMLYNGNHLIKSGRIADNILTVKEGTKTVADGVFNGNKTLECVYLPESLVSIGAEAFADCTELKIINIPFGAGSIGHGAFSGCHSLTSVYITDLCSWCGIEFLNRESNPLTNRARLDLCGQTVTDIDISEGLNEVAKGAFCGYRALKSLRLGGSVRRIGGFAFDGCAGLESAELSEGIEYIGAYAFAETEGLRCISLPHGVRSVEYAAFFRSGIKSITLPEGIESIGQKVFSESKLEEVVIPGSIKALKDSAFRSCMMLRRVVVGNGVESVMSGAFTYCSGLDSVELPPSVRYIANGAFYGCHRLVVTVTRGSYAEKYCKTHKLQYVYKKED